MGCDVNEPDTIEPEIRFEPVPVECHGPFIKLHDGWIVHLCDACILFPCEEWR